MARVFAGLFGRKEVNERPDQSGSLADAILAANNDRLQLRATIEHVAAESERRDKAIREGAHAAAQKLRLRRPGQQQREDPDREKSVKDRHEAAMLRGLDRIGALTAIFRFDLDEGALQMLAARALGQKEVEQPKEPQGENAGSNKEGHESEQAEASQARAKELEDAKRRQSEGAASNKRESESEPPEALKESGGKRRVDGSFNLPVAELRKLLQDRFGNLDVINRPISGSLGSSSEVPLVRNPREREPDRESAQCNPNESELDDPSNRGQDVSSDATAPAITQIGETTPKPVPDSDQNDGKGRG
jgi:hypothetical protein